jgi:hypothetical protein
LEVLRAVNIASGLLAQDLGKIFDRQWIIFVNPGEGDVCMENFYRILLS